MEATGRSWRREDTTYALFTTAAFLVVAYICASAIGVTPTPIGGDSGTASVRVDVGIARPLPVVALAPQVPSAARPVEVARSDMSEQRSAAPSRPVMTTTRRRGLVPAVGRAAGRVTTAATGVAGDLVAAVQRILTPSSNVSR